MRLHTFIVIFVKSEQIFLAQPRHRRIINNRQEIRQNRLVHFLRERLPFGNILLPMPFRAVTENFVEKHRRRPPGKQRRTIERLRHRRCPQRLQV